MKKILTVVGIVLVVLVAIAVVFILFGSHQAPNTGSPSVSFPSASSTLGGTINTQVSTVETSTGAVISVSDFMHNGTTVADPSNQGRYYLTGTDSDEFSIAYDTSGQSFTVSLDQEPIGETRIHAETFLRNALGISQQQMCSLKYFITTTSFVNATYAGQNLGFSFCPGAVVLPQ